ncbi:MAG TPA: choice-of-anchor R domain-containing protein [Verrucomicrobiae bacterium]|nr:choice-of-anchor R domain-containing protein [Verrucomicrobiae bacterium]
MFTPIGNLNQTFGEDIAVWSGLSQAASFKTGDTSAWLFSISVAMDSRHQFAPGNFNLAIYSDAGGSPGSSLATLSGNDVPYIPRLYTYTNATPLVLSSNTTYWVVASSPTTSSAAYQWGLTFSSNLDSGSIWTMGAGDLNQGSGWEPIGNGYFPQFSVTVTNPQPPALSISQPIVLTFPTNGFQFVLQENSNLSTTNWTAVTNVILSGVISNQTVFIVPSAGQMFFRLSSP